MLRSKYSKLDLVTIGQLYQTFVELDSSTEVKLSVTMPFSALAEISHSSTQRESSFRSSLFSHLTGWLADWLAS